MARNLLDGLLVDEEAVLGDPLGGLLRYGLQSVDWRELAEHLLAADN